MTGFRRIGAILALVAGLFAAAGASAQTPPQPLAQAVQADSAKSGGEEAALADGVSLQPRAMELLQAMCERLARAKSMSFTADVNYEYPSRLGPPVVYAMRYQAAMKRPDKLRVLMPGDGPTSEFYYDGKEMIAYAPAENLAAVASAPGNMDEALKQAFEQADIYFPFTDLIVDDPYAALVKGAKLAFLVGPSGMADGTKTRSLVLADEDVFLQIWIGDDMLPRRLRAMYSADPLKLRHDMELSNWKIDAPFAASVFTSKKARSAKPMAFARPALPSAPGAEASQSGQTGAPNAPNALQ